MDILQHTSSNLIIKFDPISGWMIIAFIMLCSFGMIGGLSIWMLPSQTTALGEAMLIFCLILLFITLRFLFLPTVVATFDKNHCQFILERTWFWKSEMAQYPIQTINDIQVIQKGRFGKERRYFKIFVKLDTGELLPLSAMYYRPEIVVRHQADFIRTFLHLTRDSRASDRQEG